MKKYNSKYLKLSVAYWLINIGVLLSVFAFSGYCNSSIQFIHEPSQTELVETKTDHYLYRAQKLTLGFTLQLTSGYHISLECLLPNLLANAYKPVYVRLKSYPKHNRTFIFQHFRLPLKSVLSTDDDYYSLPFLG